MPPELFTRVLDYGGIACVLAWMMFKMEPRLKEQEDAIDRLSESIQLLLISLEHIPERVRRRATELKEQTDQAKINRHRK